MTVNELEEFHGAPSGSYGLGALGALLGALVGSVIWAGVLYAGYVASLVGLLMGFLADKGYSLLGGRQGMGRVPILILAAVLGIVFGTLLAEGFSILSMISSGELLGFRFSDAPLILWVLLTQDREFLGTVAGNLASGLLFGALGLFLALKPGKRKQ